MAKRATVKLGPQPDDKRTRAELQMEIAYLQGRQVSIDRSLASTPLDDVPRDGRGEWSVDWSVRV